MALLRVCHAEAAREHRLEHLAGVDLLDEARDAGLVPGAPLRVDFRRHDGRVEGRRHLALRRRLQRPHDIGQTVSRADAVERRHARDLCQVVEHDHRRRQVEDGIRHGERIRFRHRHALPAGGCLVGQVADARCEREGRIAGHRLDLGKGCAEHLERIVTALHDERPALDARRSNIGRSGLRPRRSRAGTRIAGRGAARRQPGVSVSAASSMLVTRVGVAVVIGPAPGTTKPPSSQGRRLVPRCHPWFGPDPRSALISRPM